MKFGPVTELCRITTDANKNAVRWRRAIQDKQLVPSWRRNICVGRRSNGADRTRARKFREDSTSAHDIAVRARHRRKERDAHILALEQLHVDLVLPAVRPVRVRHRHCGLGQSLAKVWRGVHLDA